MLSISNFINKYYLDPLDLLLTRKPFNISDQTSRQAIIGTCNAFAISLSIFYFLQKMTKTSSPISSVLSGSMIPTMYRGDILILTKNIPKTIVFDGKKGSNLPKGDLIASSSEEEEEDVQTDESNDDKIKEKRSLLLKYGDLQCGDIIVFNVKGLEKAAEKSYPNKLKRNRNQNSSDSSAGVVHRIISLHIHHRTGEVFVLTKGDNNEKNDREFIYPPPNFYIPLNDETFGGKVIARIPLVGRVSVFIHENVGIVGRLAILGLALGLAYYVEYFEKKGRMMTTSSDASVVASVAR